MRLSRIITAFMAGLAIAVAPAAAGAAQPYTPQPPELTLSDTTINLGESVTIYGRGFGEREFVVIRIDVEDLAAGALPGRTARRADGTTVALAAVGHELTVNRPDPPRPLRVRARADGTFEVRYRPPRSGLYTFTAVGQRTGRTTTAELTVLGRGGDGPPNQPGGPNLPVTGDSVGDQVALGGGLLAGGLGLLMLTLVWRRRSQRGQTA